MVRRTWCLAWLGLAALATACPADDSNDDKTADASAIDAAGSDAPGVLLGADARNADTTSSVDGGLVCPTATKDDPSAYTALDVVGNTGCTLGSFDPTLWYPAASDGGFMSFSCVGARDAIHTRVAFSTDHGTKWTLAGAINQPEPIVITNADGKVCGQPTCSGHIIHEVSSITYDESDPVPARRFKVVTHSYFAIGEQIFYDVGALNLFTTTFPVAGAVWTEEKLLGWNSRSPYSSENVKQNVSKDVALAGLADCLLLTEPSLVSRGGVLDLAVGCPRVDVASSSTPIEIRLLRSKDHGKSWSFVATLLSRADAVALGASGKVGAQVNAPNLAVRGGRTYLLVSPNGKVGDGADGNGYRGCLAIELDDVDAGKVKRCGGKPVVALSFLNVPSSFIGACTYAEGATANGVVAGIPSASPPVFRMFSSHTQLP